MNRYDKRPSVQRIVEIRPEEVVKKRTCRFTTAGHEQVGFWNRQVSVPAHIVQLGTDAVRDYVFENGPLYCRWVHISINEDNGKAYAGEVRRLYNKEKNEFEQLSKNRTGKDGARHGGDDDVEVNVNPRIRRSSSVEPLDYNPRKRRLDISSTPRKLTFGDFFCGAGGASYGAVKAGLQVKFGLEIMEDFMESYKRNHPGAETLRKDARDFSMEDSRQDYRVDQVHLSTPCKFFSACQ